METLMFSVNAVAPLALMMALGYLLKSLHICSESFFKEANRLSFKILLPVMLFNNIYSAGTDGTVFDWRYIGFTAAAVVAVLVILMVTVPLFVKDRKRIGVVIQGIYRSNFLVFGTPLVMNMFGESELWSTTMLLPLVVPVFNVAAVLVLNWYVSEDRGWKRIGKTAAGILKTPLIVGAIVSYFCLLIRLPIPAAVQSVLSRVSSMGSNLALLALGGTLEFAGFKKNLGAIAVSVLGRLVIVPCAVLPFAVMLGWRGSAIGALLALFGSPVAISSYAMSIESGNDGELAGQLVVVSTVFSVVSMFFLIFTLRMLGYL